MSHTGDPLIYGLAIPPLSMPNEPSNSIFYLPRVLFVSRLHAACINIHILSLRDTLPFAHFLEGITVIAVRLWYLPRSALLQAGETVVEGMQGRQAANDNAEW